MKNKYLKYILNLSVAALLFSVTGCLKDSTSPGSENYGSSPALVSFQYSGFAFVPGIASILGTAQDTFSVEVTLSVNTQTLNKDVTATIAADESTLSTYNADTTQSNYGTTFIQLPTSEYTLPNNGAVTIPAGKNIISFTVHLAGDKIDYTKDNALALKITNASGATISTNLNTYIIIIKLKSIYAGTYSGGGERIRYSGATVGSGVSATSDISGDIPFGTVGLKEINGQLADAGSGYNMALIVHDNLPAPYPVDVVPDPLNPSPSSITEGNSSGAGSSYDPTTHTFTLHFSYLNGAGALREVNETLVLE